MYILEDYEDTWNYSGRIRTASYMNLDPGTYTFRVTASNNDNVWNETGASIGITVMAPFYATPLAMLVYVVVLSVLLFILMRIVRFRAEKENELMLERAEKARIKELNIRRLQFFTNISHEFRTPLTLIAGPIDKLISGKYVHQTDYLLQLMKSNVNRMLRQVNQLMDFRNWSLRPEEISIAHVMTKAGYASAHFGKWHVGPVKKESPTGPGAMRLDIPFI